MAMDALSREQSWKNRRKRSLYVSHVALSPILTYKVEVSFYSNKCLLEVEEGYAGFIFYRKSKASRGKGDTDDEQTITPQETNGENLPVESEV